MSEDRKKLTDEIDRLRGELLKARQVTDKYDKLVKNHGVLETKMQDMKKQNLMDQSEIKDLKVRLRLSENEKQNLTGKHGEVSDAKRALHSLEMRRREESKERDKRIQELEKQLSLERKKFTALDVQMSSTLAKATEQTRARESEIAHMKQQLAERRAEIESTASSLAAHTENEAELLENLEAHRLMLSRIAEEYGRLASCTVSRTKHSQLEDKHLSSTSRILKLERRLANSEGHVTELVFLLKQMRQLQAEEAETLTETLEELDWYRQARIPHQPHHSYYQYDRVVRAIELDYAQTSQDKGRISESVATAMLDRVWNLWRHCHDQLEVIPELADAMEINGYTHEQDLAASQANKTAIVEQLEELRSAHVDVKMKLEKSEASLAKYRRERQEIEDIKSKTEGKVQILRMTEDGLRADIDQLTSDLAEAEQYKTAYYSYIDQVGLWADSMNLAEQEAERLAKLNAEIVGHHNPAQRILYVDRLRRELAEARQHLLVATRDRDHITSNNEALSNELELYKSVMVVEKPTTIMTRVERKPLASISANARLQG